MAWSTSARKADLPSNWTALRISVLKDAKYRCEIRGPECSTHATDVDHVRRGNDHSRANLRAACSKCHDKKSAQEGNARKAELRARRFRPAERHPGALR